MRLIPGKFPEHFPRPPQKTSARRLHTDAEAMAAMRLEFHQLDRRWECLRACHPARQRRLLASLAESGQQTPIVVVAADQPNRYVVIDGYKRIAALEQLGRDTVEAVVWPLSEAGAVLLDRSLRFSEQETALEVGWLLAELEQRFGYGLEELARRFDRSVSWVSRRLALVEVLPEALQEQVRQGQIPAQVAMKFLAPVARQSLEDCQRMAAIFAQRRSEVREAGQLYAAWRKGSCAVRKRLLEEPELFFKTQRQQSRPADTELLRDLEMAAAIVNRAQRRLAGAAELDGRQRESARRQIERMQGQLQRIGEQLEGEQETHVEPKSTHGDSGTGRPGSRQAGDRAGAGREPDLGAPGAARPFGGSARAGSWGEGGALPAADPGSAARVQGQPGPGP
jgi:ParB family transcriptional regulator, chromosome partitioning protein